MAEYSAFTGYFFLQSLDGAEHVAAAINLPHAGLFTLITILLTVPVLLTFYATGIAATRNHRLANFFGNHLRGFKLADVRPALRSALRRSSVGLLIFTSFYSADFISGMVHGCVG